MSVLIGGLVLAGALVALLLSVAADGQWVTVLASLAGFATAITVIAAAVISWEHVIVNARTAGLVEFEVESR
jgi:nicotinamide riboside transporter PnuC